MVAIGTSCSYYISAQYVLEQRLSISDRVFCISSFDFHIFQTYTCDVFFAQSWKDNRLRLPDNMTSEYRLLPIEWLTEIWRPDSFFKNAKSVNFQTMTIPNHYIWLWKDKTILYMVK